MYKWLFLLISCFMVHTSVSAYPYEQYAVVDEVQYFGDYYGNIDPEGGEWFWLHDGSSWMRTCWSGPIYHLYAGQSVVVFPMTYEEEMLYRLPNEWYHYRPYWIVYDGYHLGVAYSLN